MATTIYYYWGSHAGFFTVEAQGFPEGFYRAGETEWQAFEKAGYIDPNPPVYIQISEEQFLNKDLAGHSILIEIADGVLEGIKSVGFPNNWGNALELIKKDDHK